MNKNSQILDISYDKEIIDELAAAYDFSPRYIRQILNDDRTPVFADKVKEAYKVLKAKKDAATENRKNALKDI